MNPLYQSTVPVFSKLLRSLDAILEKTEGWVKEKGIDEAELLEARLAPDMFPLVKQVQSVCDNAKNSSARLAGVEAPRHADEEKTIAELRARILWTSEYLATLSESSFDGAADRQITLPYFPGKFQKGSDYALDYVLPNFFFHLVVAYAILRMKGLDIGKADYIGGLTLQDV